MQQVGNGLDELLAGDRTSYAPTGSGTGVVLPGGSLATMGLMAPLLRPETAVVYLAEAVREDRTPGRT